MQKKMEATTLIRVFWVVLHIGAKGRGTTLWDPGCIHELGKV